MIRFGKNRKRHFDLILALTLLLACSACALPIPGNFALIESTAILSTAASSPTRSGAELNSSPTPTLAATSSASPTPALPSLTLSPTSAPPTSGPPAAAPTITLTPPITRSPTPTRWVWSTFTPVPTRTPTITPTLTPPPAYLRILRPGVFSRLLSPIQVQASVSPGEDGLVLVELLGEDGRSLAQQRLDYYEYISLSIAITPKLSYTLNGVSELGRLILSVNDQFGRKIAITTEDLVLFSIGDNEFSSSHVIIAPYVIQLPFADQIIQGGTLHVRGLARPVNQNPILLDLLNEQGVSLASAQLQIPLPSGSLSHNPFEVDLLYQVNAPIHARLTIRQESASRIPGTVALWSVPINLEP